MKNPCAKRQLRVVFLLLQPNVAQPVDDGERPEVKVSRPHGRRPEAA